MRSLERIKLGLLFLAVTLWAGAAFAQNGAGQNGGNGNNGNTAGQSGANAGSATNGGNTMTGQSAGGNGGGAGVNAGGAGAGVNGSGFGAGAGAGAGQNGANGANAGAGASGVGANGGGNAGYLSGNFQARVPQYWVADASIFINNAINTAQVMTREQSLNVQDPQIFANQGAFLRNATGRAVNDLQGLLSNAMQTQPAAVPQIRAALAELTAAEAQANTFAQAASSGNLGPTYLVTIKSNLAHLRAAERQMKRVAGDYNAGNFAQASNAGGR